MNQQLTWAQFKQICITEKSLRLQYIDHTTWYYIFASDSIAQYWLEISQTDPRNEDQIDFEDNYKSSSNQDIQPHDTEGKCYVRAESRPLNCTTCFTTCGDTDGDNPNIGNGGRMAWDAADPSGWTTVGAPSGFKQFSTIVSFCDSIWLKEGTIYYMNCMKGSYCDMEVICPSGYYFLYNGAPAQAQEDTIVDHYLFKHPMQGSVPMGDELNTETCSQELPTYLQFKFSVTVPEGDEESYGYMEMEIYRTRTVVL